MLEQNLSSRGGQIHVIGLLICAVVVAGCASFEPKPLDGWPDPARTQTAEKEQVRVSAGILGDEHAQQVFGVNLADVGLQAIWLRIDNRSERDWWLLVSALDPRYYSPDEAAVLFHPIMSNENDIRVTEHFRRLSMPLKTSEGEVSEGYILAPRHEGGRYVSIPLLSSNRLLDFGFALPLPDGEFDYEELEIDRLLSGQVIVDLDVDGMRDVLREAPCCTRNEAGDREGDPLNLVMVGDVDDVIASLSRGGWSFTHRIDSHTVWRMISATLSGNAYPVAPISPLYVSGRKQDIALQRARSTIVQRNHLRLWVMPYRFDGKPVWIGQVSRDVGVKATTLSPTLTTHVIDPHVDESRENLLQSLLVAGSVKRFGFVDGAPLSTPQSPSVNLTEDPYYSDGQRVFIQVVGSGNIPPEDAEYMHWGHVEAPLDVTRDWLPKD